MADVLLGVDIGTSSTKGVITHADGTVLASAQREHKTEFPRPGEKPATGDPTKDPALKSPVAPPVTPPSDPGAGAPKDAPPGEPSRG